MWQSPGEPHCQGALLPQPREGEREPQSSIHERRSAETVPKHPKREHLTELLRQAGYEGLRKIPVILHSNGLLASLLWAAASCSSQDCSHQRCRVWRVNPVRSCLHGGTAMVPPASHAPALQASPQPGLFCPVVKESPCELLSERWVPSTAMVSACPWLLAGCCSQPTCQALQGINPWGAGTGRCHVHAGSQLVGAALALFTDVCGAHKPSAAACLSWPVLCLRNKEINDPE